MGSNNESSVVECLDCSLEAAQRLGQAHVHLQEQIHVLAFESGVFALLENDNNITGLQTWRLVALAVERDFLSILHTLVDVNLEDLALVHNLAALARLAHVLGVDLLALAITVATRRVYLLVHAGAELIQNHLVATTAARTALLHGALLATLAAALVTDDVLLQG